MAQIDVYNKKRGVTYVYESVSYWDKELKQPRSKRKLIGKRDADGNLIPTGPRGRKKVVTEEADSKAQHSDLEYQAKCEQYLSMLRDKDNTIMELKQQLADAQRENFTLRRIIEQTGNTLIKALQ